MEAPQNWSAIDREDWAERAAILEYEANMPRLEAEIRALREIEARRKKERNQS